MNKIENKKFFMERNLDKNSAVKIKNQELINCVFDNCSIGIEDNLSKISLFKNIKIVDCTIFNCLVGPAIFEDIVIKNLKTGDIAIFYLPLLKHVKIEGRVGSLKINNNGFILNKDLSLQKELLDFKNKFYETVDWALDISCAKFVDFYCLGIPAHLIKINNENQFIAKRSNIIKSGILNSDFSTKNPIVDVMLQFLIDSNEEETVLAAPMAKAKKQRDLILSGLLKLRDQGILE